MDKQTLAVFLQGICVMLLFLEYGSQFFKLLKVKESKDISVTFWVTKLTIATLQVFSLFLVGAVASSYVSQVLGIVCSIIVFATVLHYRK